MVLIYANVTGYLRRYSNFPRVGEHAFQYNVLKFCLFKGGIGNLMHFS